MLENVAMQSSFSEDSTRFRTKEAAHQNIQNKSHDLKAGAAPSSGIGNCLISRPAKRL
jgi:hypothetical protein